MLDPEPLGRVAVRQRIRRILRDPKGRVMFSRHARLDRMGQRKITKDEVLACLARGHCGANITFDSETLAIVVNAWRTR